jgi:lipoprotein signal peptidase
MKPVASLQWLLDFHKVWAYVAISANAIAGILALVAWRVRAWRGRWLWIVTIVAEAMMMLQVLVGVALVASDDYVAPRFHMFYGFLAFLTVGIAYSYRQQMRGRRELFYGLVGLFIMGLGIRAILQAT